jgi:hypothetical protein
VGDGQPNKEEELAFVNPVSREVFPTRGEPLGLAPGLEGGEVLASCPDFGDGETHLPLLLLRSVIPGRIWWPVGTVVLEGLVNRRLDPSLKFLA